MNPCNAIIKDWTLRESECYSRCLELVLTLDLQGGGGCCFRATGVYEKKWTKNQFAYAVKRVLEITEADISLVHSQASSSCKLQTLTEINLH